MSRVRKKVWKYRNLSKCRKIYFANKIRYNIYISNRYIIYIIYITYINSIIIKHTFSPLKV